MLVFIYIVSVLLVVLVVVHGGGGRSSSSSGCSSKEMIRNRPNYFYSYKYYRYNSRNNTLIIR